MNNLQNATQTNQITQHISYGLSPLPKPPSATSDRFETLGKMVSNTTGGVDGKIVQSRPYSADGCASLLMLLEKAL